jgi:hypothetical protein
MDCDPLIGKDQIIGVLASMRDKKGEKVRNEGDLSARVYSFLVMNIPYVSFILNRYVNRNKSRWMTRIFP